MLLGRALTLAFFVALPACALDRSGLAHDSGLSIVDSASADGPAIDARADTGTPDACSPAASDPCGGGDDDCDGTVDEDCSCTDGTVEACGPCGDGTRTCTGGLFDDCTGGTAPIDYYPDLDADGFGDAAASATSSCTPVAGSVADATDCDDGCASCFPGGAETCNGEDDDCDGTADDGVTLPFAADRDGDGQGDPASVVAACAPPGPEWTMDASDCDDSCRLCWSGFPAELCGDARDNDCDGTTDVGCTCTAFVASGRTYVHCPLVRSFDAARAECMLIGADLASFETPAENAAVWAVVDGFDRITWVGGSDRVTDGSWSWVSGALICGAPSPSACDACAGCAWNTGQPNGGTAENCLALRIEGMGRWNDWPCDGAGTIEAYLCELP